jgi:hypothetical protein
MKPVWAIFLRLWPDVPVFHAFGGFRGPIGQQKEHTACGREVGPGTPFMPMKHAIQFGRACRSCWPNVLERAEIGARNQGA